MGQDTFIGVDAGGTATRAVLVDGEGLVLRQSTMPAGNPHVGGAGTGVSAAARAISEVLEGATTTASPPPRAAVIALSGGDDEGVVRAFERGVLGAGVLPARTQLLVCHDVAAPAAMVLGGAYDRDRRRTREWDGAGAPQCCAVVVAGTGSVAAAFRLPPAPLLQQQQQQQQRRRHLAAIPQPAAAVAAASSEASGVEVMPGHPASSVREEQPLRLPIELVARAGGRGPLVGDDGSAHAIAASAVAHALRMHDGLVAPAAPDDENHARDVLATSLVALGVRHVSDFSNNNSHLRRLREADVAALTAALHAPSATRDRVAALAPPLAALASHSHANNNRLAAAAFSHAGIALGRLAYAIVQRAFPIILYKHNNNNNNNMDNMDNMDNNAGGTGNRNVNGSENGMIKGHEEQVVLVLTGGVFEAWHSVPPFRTALRKALRKLPRPVRSVVRLVAPPGAQGATPAAVGAARLAMLMVYGMDAPAAWARTTDEYLQPLDLNETEEGDIMCSPNI